jgi:signal transduction histidine kinase
VASVVPRAGSASQYAAEPTTARFTSPGALTLRNWPVSTRLIAVIVLALAMGLVFGGLRVASAAGSASEFGGVSQLAALGQQVTSLVQAMENERDETTGLVPLTNTKQLETAYAETDAAAARVQSLAAGIGGSFPANIQSRVAAVVSQITHLSALRISAQASQSALAVIVDYSAPITDMIALNGQIAQGTSDSVLVNDVQTLNSLSLAKDQAAQQRAILYNAFNQAIFADGELQALQTAQSEELTDLTAFNTTATPAEQNTYNNFVNTVDGTAVNEAQNIEIYVVGTGVPDIGAGALDIGMKQAPAAWYSAQSAKVNAMQQTELEVAGNIVARARSLQGSAENSALVTAVLTAIILFLVLLATVAVARSLVGPLRRLREGALNIATVELPERVRLLGEAQDSSTSLEVAPIDVLSTDEIGQVARAFDQVHSEAVRLASNEASLRNSFNAMFVNLSRRSQSLIERLVRMIDSLEQNEDDPDRLSNLFSMDHLVTRMRRNSENLLLLAGHEGARKWSDPVPLADVARAAVSEIEQYSRVTLKIQPGIAVTGPAVSDVVHLLAEVIENATIFSPKDSAVQVSGQELASGGVLIEVSDSGVGIPEARLAEINWRLDNPPVIDVSVSRHMGLFAVARLAERHAVRVRLRARAPHGLTALVWLPDTVIERGRAQAPSWAGRLEPQPATAGRQSAGRHSVPVPVGPDGQPSTDQFEAITPAAAAATVPGPVGPASPASPAGPREPTHAASAARSAGAASAASAATSDWFRSRRPSVTDPAGNGGGSPGGQSGSFAAAAQAGGQRSFGTGGWAEGRQAAQIVADPVRGDRTTAGLPMRVPRANLLPGSAGGAHRAGAPSRAAAHVPQVPAAPRPPRSPDIARTRLSGFQSGVRRAKSDTTRAGEGADR